jgi:DNA-binding protein HU-beta
MLSKSDLVKRLSEKTSSTQKEAEAHLNAFLEVVRDSLHEGEEVKIVGFGAFSVQETAAREGVNPRTREKIQIAAGKRVKFSAGKELQDAIEPAAAPVDSKAAGKGAKK